jgi:hypothetical protein
MRRKVKLMREEEEVPSKTAHKPTHSILLSKEERKERRTHTFGYPSHNASV